MLHSAAVGASVVGVVRPLSRHSESLTAANWVSFDFNVSCRVYSLINPTRDSLFRKVYHKYPQGRNH